jgi:16S rRNA (uracil1498-N3)-methyltransferase
MNVFYKTEICSDTLILDPSESNHCIKVLRYVKGDEVRIIDGKGGYYIGKIESEDPKACMVRIVSSFKQYEKMPYQLNIAISPTKNIDRFEWFIEKATEIGVSSIIPVLCRRSERRNIRMDRLEKIVISAMKQSVKAYRPNVYDLMDYNEWIKGGIGGSLFIAHCYDSPKMDIREIKITDNNTILIGPEGDFTEEEIELATSNGFHPVSLGKYRLRTETAGVVACTAFSLKFGI